MLKRCEVAREGMKSMMKQKERNDDVDEPPHNIGKGVLCVLPT